MFSTFSKENIYYFPLDLISLSPLKKSAETKRERSTEGWKWENVLHLMNDSHGNDSHDDGHHSHVDHTVGQDFIVLIDM